jgi:hypothetical protein
MVRYVSRKGSHYEKQRRFVALLVSNWCPTIFTPGPGLALPPLSKSYSGSMDFPLSETNARMADDRDFIGYGANPPDPR